MNRFPLALTLMLLVAAILIAIPVLTPDPQNGGHFAGIPIAVYDGEVPGAWAVYLSTGERGTSGNWREVRLYGLGEDWLPLLEAAIETGTWLDFETDSLDGEWNRRYGLQGVITAISIDPDQGWAR